MLVHFVTDEPNKIPAIRAMLEPQHVVESHMLGVAGEQALSYGVLVVDGVFAFRPEVNRYWDLRVWVETDAELSVRRGIERDAEAVGGASEAEMLHRDRYLASEMIYMSEVDPRSFAEVIVDNTDFDRPRLVRPAV